MKTQKATRGETISKADKKAHVAMRKARKNGRGRQWQAA